MAERTTPRVWMIDDSEPLREVYGTAILNVTVPVSVFGWDEAEEWRAMAGLPDSVALSGWDLVHRASACRPYLDCVPRILILTDSPITEVALSILERPGIAALHLPFTLDEFDGAMRWLSWESLEPEWDGAEVAETPAVATRPQTRPAERRPAGMHRPAPSAAATATALRVHRGRRDSSATATTTRRRHAIWSGWTEWQPE